MRYVRIVGVPASGKSTLAARLASDLGVPHLDIASQPGHLRQAELAWKSLRLEMTKGPAVVETAGVSPHEASFWDHMERITVRVTVPRMVQMERLMRRGRAASEPGYVRRMMGIPEPPAGDIEWRGTEPTSGPAYRALLQELRSRP